MSITNVWLKYHNKNGSIDETTYISLNFNKPPISQKQHFFSAVISHKIFLFTVFFNVQDNSNYFWLFQKYHIQLGQWKPRSATLPTCCDNVQTLTEGETYFSWWSRYSLGGFYFKSLNKTKMCRTPSEGLF